MILYLHKNCRVGTTDEEADWLRRAKSAAAFYKTDVSDYDNRKENDDDDDDDGDANDIIDSNEALEEAVKGCTAIVSCVGSARPTNVWTDLLARPVFRLLRCDVSRWCKDPRHPFYVNYASTRKVVGLAEREQLKRDAAVMAQHGDDEDANRQKQRRYQSDDDSSSIALPPRIRFVRISDLCVSFQPWHFIPMLTNALQSMVFRYQDMTERLLEASPVLDTVVLRPGDLTDDDRDNKKVSLQVDPAGKVPSPARVGRDDVAALAVSACLFQSEPRTSSTTRPQQNSNHGDDPELLTPQTDSSENKEDESFHYTLGVRWVGQDMGPVSGVY